MKRIADNGKRLVTRVVLLQAGSACVVASAYLAFDGAPAAWSALVGGLIAAVGSALFGWRMFMPGIAAAAALRRAMYAGEALKWLWTIIAVWTAFAHWRLPPLPLIVGLIVAQFGIWFGLIGMKRG